MNFRAKKMNYEFWTIIIIALVTGSFTLDNNIFKNDKNNLEVGNFMDERDGQVYTWKLLKDNKRWMSVNLNFKTQDSWCYNNNDSICTKYGRLYTWDSAQKACPNGWHLPSDKEWHQMTSYYGKAFNNKIRQEKNEEENAGEHAYKVLLNDGSSGFNAFLGGGLFPPKLFSDIDEFAGYYWTSTEASDVNSWHYVFIGFQEYLYRDYTSKNLGSSCRCVQD